MRRMNRRNPASLPYGTYKSRTQKPKCKYLTYRYCVLNKTDLHFSFYLVPRTVRVPVVACPYGTSTPYGRRVGASWDWDWSHQGEVPPARGRGPTPLPPCSHPHFRLGLGTCLGAFTWRKADRSRRSTDGSMAHRRQTARRMAADGKDYIATILYSLPTLYKRWRCRSSSPSRTRWIIVDGE